MSNMGNSLICQMDVAYNNAQVNLSAAVSQFDESAAQTPAAGAKRTSESYLLPHALRWDAAHPARLIVLDRLY